MPSSAASLSVPPPSLEPGARIDRYEPLCHLATGGMANVWLARRLTSGLLAAATMAVVAPLVLSLATGGTRHEPPPTVATVALRGFVRPDPAPASAAALALMPPPEIARNVVPRASIAASAGAAAPAIAAMEPTVERRPPPRAGKRDGAAAASPSKATRRSGPAPAPTNRVDETGF